MTTDNETRVRPLSARVRPTVPHGGAGFAVSVDVHMLMSLPLRSDSGFSHAVREHESAPLCGADAVYGEADWPELGQPWPAGPSRCSACAQVMSASRRG